MLELAKVYSAYSILKGFRGTDDVKVDWFKMIHYYEDPYDYPPFDEWLNDQYWSELVAGYMRLDKRARWKARHYVSEFFPEHFLKCLRSFVEDRLRTSVFVEEVSLPLRFKNRKTGKEQTPYLFISSPNNTIIFEPDLEEDDGLFFELCGHLNFGNAAPIEGAGNVRSQLRKYMRRLRN
jgi:hypothetical protein